MAKRQGRIIHTSEWTSTDGEKFTFAISFDETKLQSLVSRARKAEREGRKQCTLAGGAFSVQAATFDKKGGET